MRRGGGGGPRQDTKKELSVKPDNSLCTDTIRNKTPTGINVFTDELNQDSSANPIDERYPLVFNLVNKPLPHLLPYSDHCPHIYTFTRIHQPLTAPL
nr:hypothetical protein Iba_chr15dCG7950 [Ipomoea batatas]